MANAAIDALGEESMGFADLETQRPVLPEIRMRAMEEPEADSEANDSGDERRGMETVFSERKRRRHDPDQGDDEAGPRERQEQGLSCRLPAPYRLDRSASL